MTATWTTAWIKIIQTTTMIYKNMAITMDLIPTPHTKPTMLTEMPTAKTPWLYQTTNPMINGIARTTGIHTTGATMMNGNFIIM